MDGELGEQAGIGAQHASLYAPACMTRNVSEANSLQGDDIMKSYALLLPRSCMQHAQAASDSKSKASVSKLTWAVALMFHEPLLLVCSCCWLRRPSESHRGGADVDSAVC